MTENNLNNQPPTIWDQLTKGIEELKAQLETKDKDIKWLSDHLNKFMELAGRPINPTDTESVDAGLNYFEEYMIRCNNLQEILDLAEESINHLLSIVKKNTDCPPDCDRDCLLNSRCIHFKFFQKLNEIRNTSSFEIASIWTKQDYEIKQLLYKLLEKAGYKSDVLGIIGSWKDTVSDQEILEDLKKVME